MYNFNCAMLLFFKDFSCLQMLRNANSWTEHYCHISYMIFLILKLIFRILSWHRHVDSIHFNIELPWNLKWQVSFASFHCKPLLSITFRAYILRIYLCIVLKESVVTLIRAISLHKNNGWMMDVCYVTLISWKKFKQTNKQSHFIQSEKVR